MPHFIHLPIMPKESKTPTVRESSDPYPLPGQRIAAIWSAADDEILLKARASGLNWGPISTKHFPNKTANACRKRHERLMERRHAEDWDADKLELLAQTYMECRKEMWEVLASKLGERWHVLEQKCMEKGLKTLQATARTAQRRASAASAGQAHQQPDDQGIPDHNSDSGIGLGSDTEMEAGDCARPSHKATASWPGIHYPMHSAPHHPEHMRSLSLPHPIPIYRPPPLPLSQLRRTTDATLTASPDSATFRPQRYSPESQQRGISIQSVLSPVEPEHPSQGRAGPT